MPEPTRRKIITEEAAPVKAQKYATNPFLESLVLVPKRKAGKVQLHGLSVVHSETGQMEPAYHAYSRLDDTATFTKLFREGLAWLPYLNAPGLKVFVYLCNNMRPGNSVAWLTHAEYSAETGNTKASYYTGLNELIVANFLAPSNQKGFYFVNPAFIFNGNRLAMRHEFTKPVKSR